jgi:hypothetical protein
MNGKFKKRKILQPGRVRTLEPYGAIIKKKFIVLKRKKRLHRRITQSTLKFFKILSHGSVRKAGRRSGALNMYYWLHDW